MIDVNTDPDTTFAILLLSDALDKEQKETISCARACLRLIRTADTDVWPEAMAARIERALLEFDQIVRDDATKRGIWFHDGLKLIQRMNDDTGEVQTTTVLNANNDQVVHKEGGALVVFPQDPNQICYGEGLVFQEGVPKDMAVMTPPEEVREKRALERQQKEAQAALEKAAKEAQAALDRAAKQAKKNKKERERRKRKVLAAVGGGKEDEEAAEGEVAE